MGYQPWVDGAMTGTGTTVFLKFSFFFLNSLVCNMLSYVEFYRPKFFLLESVVLGLLNHKLQVNKAGPQEGNVVAHGTVKYILRTLISLGYVPFFLPFPALKKVPLLKFSLKRYRDHVQTAIKCASASCKPGVYGSPQHRRRVIFWGARHGLPPPSSRFRRIIMPGRHNGPYGSTQVFGSTMSRATRRGCRVLGFAAMFGLIGP